MNNVIAPEFTAEDEALGRLNYEAFYEATRAWQPYPSDWEHQAASVKRGWILGAKGVIDKFHLDTAVQCGAIPPKGSA